VTATRVTLALRRRHAAARISAVARPRPARPRTTCTSSEGAALNGDEPRAAAAQEAAPGARTAGSRVVAFMA
jgi:hypothetical protein